MKNRSMRVLAAASVAAAALLAATPAVADGLTTRCQGAAGAVTVPGDLVVPKGASCDLRGTVITGEVRVQAGADLIGEDLSIAGDLIGAADAYIELTRGDIGGEVRLTDTYGAVVEGTSIEGPLLHRPGSGDGEGFLYASGIDVGGNLAARSGEIYLEASTVVGNLDSRGTVFTDARDVFVDGKLLVQEASEGSMICALVVQRGAEFTANAGPVQIGADGPLANCDAGSTSISRDLTVTGNTGGAHIADTIVLGDLHTSGNSPAATLGGNVRVRGEILDEDGAAQRRPAQSEQTRSESGERAEALRERAEQRRQDAKEDAAATGAGALT